MKVGLFGGSFDPIHHGHLDPVRAAKAALGLDRVIYLPTARPPHKPGRALAPALARYAMVELALLDEEGLYASPHELTLDRPAYTIETLEHFRREMPDAGLFLLIGGDSFADLHHWVRFREIPEAARLVVLTRPGWDLETVPLHPEVAEWARTGKALLLHQQPPVDVSSTRLRELLAAGLPLPEGAVPDLVVRYLQKYDLYR
ncbi:MAG TPA: nicotinate-nucleotide adenylyltransferase [Thermoanaerobaculia bacterium]|jgi:nicotinate-nucleotide adenylyltransferase|nr:nicotinate-nucleotide adenylyltransferase [Thermoanaerobaculia bacterium]